MALPEAMPGDGIEEGSSHCVKRTEDVEPKQSIDAVASPNACGLILKSVGSELLAEIAGEFLDLLGTSCSVHEKNGDYALRAACSPWCQFFDSIVLPNGKIPCHETHCEGIFSRAIASEVPVDATCHSGIRVFTVPICAGAEVVGTIAFAHGGPPRDSDNLRQLANQYGVDAGVLRERAAESPVPSPQLVELAKKRLQSAARLIGEIVARKRVETALAESERRFADFMAHLPAGAFIKDESGRLLYANRFLMQMFGWQDCANKTTDELLPRDVAERMMADDRKVLSGTPLVLQESVRDTDGTERVFDTYKFPIKTEGGRTLVAGITVEVTDRRRTEEALRTSEALLASIIDQSPYPMWISDHEGTLVRINRSLRELLHVSEEDVVGKYNVLKDNIVEEQNLMPLVRRVYERGEPVRFELVWDSGRLDHVRWLYRVRLVLDVNIFPIRDSNGKVTNAVIQHVDITERKRAEEALRESERRYRELLENVQLVALMVDLDGRITFCNDFLCASTGWRRDEIAGRMFTDLVAEVSQGLLSRLMDAATQAEPSRAPIEGAVVSKNGKPRWIQWNSTVLRNPSGEISGLASLGVDVTEHRVLQEQYLQAQKLESVGRLAGGVAHDFNNLLTVIGGYGNLALVSMAADDPLRSHIAEILKASDRAASLTSQLLAFSRKQVSQPRAMDLNALLIDSREMFARLVGEDVEIVTQLNHEPAFVLADPGQVHQVLMNLMVNARDAMPGGGRVTLETANVTLDEQFTELHPEVVPGSYVRLRVTDTGHGMDEETRQHLFEPFFTTKAQGRGTGLGLSTVYGIVRQGQGWIDVQSEIGRGTTLEVYLPRVNVQEMVEQPVRLRPASLQRSGTILLVEDQKQVRELAAATLRSCGYVVFEANCGEDALELAEAYAATIDLLLTDVIMPGMTGKDLAERLVPRRAGLKVLYMSGYTENTIIHRGVLQVGVEYLPKPFTPEELAAKVAAVLDSAT